MSDFNKRIASLTPEKRALLEKHLLQKVSLSTKKQEIPGRGTSDTCALSFSQERLWLYNQLEPGTPNIISCIFRVSGSLDHTILVKTLDTIVARHESLRTTFSSETGTPLQVIHQGRSIHMSVFDLGSWSEPERETEVQRLIDGEEQRLFDLSTDLMLRASLIRFSDTEHIFILIMHHIASDGWSMEIFFHEMLTLYRAYSEGKPSPLPDLPIQYADFACWQRNWMEGEVIEKQLSYWKDQLADIPEVLELPSDRARPAVRSLRGARHSIILPGILVAHLKRLSAQEGITMFTMMMAAFKTFLYRYTGQGDLCVGTFVANRTLVELEKLIGFFVNTLVLRTDLSDNPTLTELLHREHEVAMGAFDHQDIPFEKILEVLDAKRDMSFTPLFQVALAFQDVPAVSFKMPDLSFELLDSDTSVSLYDLSLIIEYLLSGMKLSFTYRTDIFEASTIERWAHNFKTLLESIAANPEEHIETLPLLTEAEKKQVVVEWNNTGAYYPGDLCMHEMIEAQVEKTPDAVAVVYEGQELTYRELNSRANKLAHYLRRQGVGPEVLVGICVDRSLEMLVGLLGILKAGGAYVPLDPAYPQERLKFMLEDADVSVLLTLERLSAGLPLQKAKPVCLDTHWDDITRESDGNPKNVVGPDNAAYVIYTSGSTGRPKGVVIEHKSFMNYTRAAISKYGLKTSDRVLQFASISFDASVEEIYPCLAHGATLVLRTDGMLSSVRDFLNTCEKWELTVLSLPTIYWHELIQGLETESLKMPDSLRLVIIGGEKASTERLMRWNKQVDLTVRLLNTYGPTEATVVATMCDLTHMVLRYGWEQIPIGQPMPNVRTYILDPYLQPVPIGASGELHIGGNGLARGYLNRPELTAEKFIPDPFNGQPGTRLYKTGDLARYLPDGNIEFLGRIDLQVKIRGGRIELEEIETVLRQNHAVREAIVTVREDQPGDKRLAAYVVPNKKSAITTSELRAFLREKLPDYMVPSAFVILDSMPLTINGKTDRKSLPAPDRGRPDLEDFFVAARTPTEELLAGIWCEVLGLKKVGVHDNFFELGGHSLLATQVISRLRNAFRVEIPLRRIFEMPTVAGLAGAVDKVLSEGEKQPALIVPVAREGGLPLSFAQERMWFFDQLQPGSSTYNMPLAVRLTGSLNVTALERSLSEILRRHEVLRTTFITENDRPVQVIASPGSFTLLLVDLDVLPGDQKEARVLGLANEEASRPFALTEGPLLRATLLKLNQQEHVLLLTTHHIVSDGWSMGIIHRELSALYEDFSKGKQPSLPDLPIQYGDFAIWQRQWLQGENLEKQLAFWKEQLNGVSPLELPADRPRPSVQAFCGAAHTVEFPETLTDALRMLSRREGATLFMTLLAAFQILLHRYTGQDDIVVGTPIANRNLAEIEGLIGFFVNTLVMRTDTSGDPEFREVLKQVRKATIDAYTHQDLPFEKLVEELQPDRDLSRHPLFQVMFALQNVPYSSPEVPGLTLGPVEIEGAMTPFDLEVHLWETAEGLKGDLVYNTALFDASTIGRMAGHFATLLERVVSNPGQRLSELPLLTEAERHQLLGEWNDTMEDYPRDKCVHELFEEQAGRTPDAIAVVFGSQEVTYRDLDRKANQLAHYLRKLGVGPEVLVGICVEHSLDMVIGVLGILKAGGAYVPLDPSYPKERLAFMIEDTKTPLILTQKQLHGVLPEHAAVVVFLDSALKITAEDNNTAPVGKVNADNLSYVIYTSGSTGKPKGVCVSHRAVNRLVMNTNYIKLEPSDRVAQASNFSFDAFTFEIWGAFLHGACLVGISKDVALSPEDFSRHLAQQGISVLFMTTALFNQMARHAPAAFHSLRYLLFGGEAVDPASVRLVLEAGPPQQLLHVYGPTESTTFTTWYRITCVPEAAVTIPIGRPVSNTTVYLVDRNLQPVPVGVPGELCIGGDGIARGYLNRPELTAEKFIPDPFCTNRGAYLYKTGDLARYRPDGNIEFEGRTDQQVKIRGFRIEPGEIEAVISRHPDVREAVVLARDDTPGVKRLVAYVCPVRESVVSTTKLRTFLREKLPEYMIPSTFVVMGALPLTPNGKVDKGALPKPGDGVGHDGKTFVAPRNDLESRLALIWEKILGVHPVGMRDNFFELGGHSLLTVQLTAEIKKLTGKNLAVMAIFHAPTIEQLTKLLNEETVSRKFSTVIPIQPYGSRTPFFWVHGSTSDSILTRYLGTDQPLYGLTHEGLDGGPVVNTSVETIAAHYILEIRKIQKKGPYCIGGHCLGGLIAFEMARQLRQRGEEVRLLFLVEPAATSLPANRTEGQPLSERNRARLRERRCLRDILSSLPDDREDHVLLPLIHLARCIKRKIAAMMERIGMTAWGKAKLLTCRVYIAVGLSLPVKLRRFYRRTIYYKAAERYRPSAYDGKMVIVASDKYPDELCNNWGSVAAKGADVYMVNGADHLSILHEPYVGTWSQHLIDLLLRRQSREVNKEA